MRWTGVDNFIPVTVLQAAFLQCVTASMASRLKAEALAEAMSGDAINAPPLMTFDVGLEVWATSRHMNSA